MSGLKDVVRRFFGALPVVREPKKDSTNLPEALVASLGYRFDPPTIEKIIYTLEQLQVPLPQKPDEFMRGTHGALIFDDYCGLLIRIEKAGTSQYGERVNGHRFVLQPLRSFDLGEAVIEVVPGTHVSYKKEQLWEVESALETTPYHLSDRSVGNTGFLPLKTPEFPNGYPVVIDRAAVECLTEETWEIAEALYRIKDDQRKFYTPYRLALLDAWPEGAPSADTAKIKAFREMCKEGRRRGDLVQGWHQADLADVEDPKTVIASKTATAYRRRLPPLSS